MSTVTYECPYPKFYKDDKNLNRWHLDAYSFEGAKSYFPGWSHKLTTGGCGCCGLTVSNVKLIDPKGLNLYIGNLPDAAGTYQLPSGKYLHVEARDWEDAEANKWRANVGGSLKQGIDLEDIYPIGLSNWMHYFDVKHASSGNAIREKAYVELWNQFKKYLPLKVAVVECFDSSRGTISRFSNGGVITYGNWTDVLEKLQGVKVKELFKSDMATNCGHQVRENYLQFRILELSV